MPKIKNVFKWVKGIPDEYQPVEYIESSGTQYINTNYTHTANTKVNLGFLITQNTSDWQFLFGQRTNYQQPTALDLAYLSTNGKLGFKMGTSTTYDSFSSISLNTKYEILMTPTTTWLSNGATASFNKVLQAGSGPCYLFRCNAEFSGLKPYAKIYFCKIYDGDTLVRDFVPCYRKSDSVIGMYDVIGQQFYTNAGSGAFTKGSDVSYTELIQKEIYPGHKGFVPGVNTMVYLPLTDDYKDVVSGTTLSTTGAVSLVTEGGVKCTRVNGGRLYGLSSAMITGSGSRTLSFWFKYNSISSSEWGTAVCRGSESNYSFYSLGDNGGVNYAFSGYSSSADIESSTTLSTGVRYNMIATYDGSTVSIYLNCTSIGSKSVGLNTGSSDLYIGGRPSGSCLANGYVSQVIVENKVWTAQERTDYYNMAKSDFGI